MNHQGCGQTIDEVSGTPTMLEKHQWAKCTGTPYSKSGSGQSVPVHPKSVPVHLSRKLAVAKVYRYTINVYRYTCMETAGIV